MPGRNLVVYLVFMWLWCIKQYAQEHAPTVPHVISFFIVPPLHPEKLEVTDHTLLKKIVSTPGTADRALLRLYHTIPLVSGIPCLYLGTLTYSDLNGQIMLPRVQETNEVTLLISDRISPVIRHGNTVERWELREKNKAQRYVLKRIEEGEQNPYWIITDEGMQETSVPTAAIVLLAPPDSLKVATSPVPTQSGPNLILPDIEITGKIPLQAAALNTIALNRFFEPVYLWKAYASDRYASLLE